MADTPTFWTFAEDEYKYLCKAYSLGLRSNAMIAQAQRVAEYCFKELLTQKLLNNTPGMKTRNLRNLYDTAMEAGLNLQDIRTQVMLLNNFYNHTSFPSKEAYMGTVADIEQAVKALYDIVAKIRRCL